MSYKVDSAAVKKLRETTGYSLADCKKALIDNNGDFSEAIKQLRAKYASKYENAQSTSEDSMNGRSFVSVSECASKVKFGFIKAKSDIVALSEQLFELMSSSLNDFCVDSCSANSDEQNTENAKSKDSFKKMLEDLLVYYREPLIVEKISGYRAGENEVIGKYFHNQFSKVSNETTITSAQKAAIVSLKSSENLDDDSKRKLTDFADLVALAMIHNERANVLHKEELNQEEIESFKNKCINELQVSGKPMSAIEKIVDSQMKIFFEANTLISSPLMIAPEKYDWLEVPSYEEISIESAMQKVAQILNTNITIPYYRIFRVIH